ncbi:MAG TPA: PilT/PilU family type 4a pilus ATPase [Nitrospiraceae bacterium]|nr:PilT/PilU family type 4a pilus ATPase [Nitrospiraceae bacterium]
MNIRDILKVMVERNASDIYLTEGLPPMYRIEGVTQPVGTAPFTNEMLEALANDVMRDKQKKEFEENNEMNLALFYPDMGRFRVNIFRQRGNVGFVIRQIKVEIVPIDKLGLPPIVKDIIMSKRGLVIVVGATGSGKSTSLAAMIDHRNANSPGHIITVEDPIEFVHKHKRSVITQREIGFDTMSYHAALKNTLRQAPDVILIGEVRDLETMEAAIAFAETGHLCLCTLHANNANQAIERVMNFFPQERHAQIYLQLSLNLRAIVSQRLIPGVDGKRVAAMEVMMDTPRVKDLIKKGEIDTIKEAMEQGVQEGCQTFDYVLFNLYREGKISLDQAIMNADSANNLRLKIKLAGLKTDEEGTPAAPGAPAAAKAASPTAATGGFAIKPSAPGSTPFKKV